MPDTPVPSVIPADADLAVPSPLALDSPEPAPGESQAATPVEVALEADLAPPTAAADTPENVDAAAPAEAGAVTDGAPDAPTQPSADTPPQAAGREMSPGACADLLKQHFPGLFAGPAKPIKLRVHADIQQRAPGVFTKGALSAFFRRYTGSTGYLIALGKASQRFDLDGQPAGELSEEHRQLARDELTRRRQVTRDRDSQAQAQLQAKTQAERAQAQAEQAQIQAEQAVALQARQARAAMLRDFSRTTLTLANFCALKGMTPDMLTPLLDQARKEAAEAPPPPPPMRPTDDRRGPGGPRRDGPPGVARDPRDSRDARDAPRRDARAGPRAPRPDGGNRSDDRPRSGAPRGPAGRPNSR